MKQKRLLLLGVFALLLAVGLNVRHALNDYGIKDSKLHIEAMAKTVDDGSKCWNTITKSEGKAVRYCPSCKYIEDSTDPWYAISDTCN